MTIGRIASNEMQSIMTKLSSGSRINSAADDAAGLAIAEKLTAQIRSLDQGTRNTEDMQSLVNTAEGALNTIGDSLTRIRELNLQASNGIMTDSDRALIQDEVDQLVDHISRTASDTEFNTQKLLDGSFNDKHTASDANGNGPNITIGNMDPSMLFGGEKMDVTGSDESRRNNLELIDNALSKVNSERSYLGAMSNRFDYTIANNQITNLNQAAARSRIADQDMASGIMQFSKKNIIQQYQIQAQLRQQEQQKNNAASLFSGI